MEVELPDGHTAVMREKLTVGGRQLEDMYSGPAREAFRKMIANANAMLEWANAGKAAEDAAKDAGLPMPERTPAPDGVPLTTEEARAAWEANYAMVVARLVSWTRPEPLPTMETIRELDGDIWDPMKDAAVKLRQANVIPVVTPDDAEDRGSPFGSSTGSAEPSSPVEDDSPTPETDSSESSGPSTNTDSDSA